MQVPHDEGVANHIGPEPCAGIREDVGEASVGERAARRWAGSAAGSAMDAGGAMVAPGARAATVVRRVELGARTPK